MYVEPHTATHPHKHGQEPHAAPALSAPPSPPSRLSSHPLPHHQQNNQRELPILCVWLGGRTARARIRTASTTPATLSLPVLQMIPCCGVESFSLTLHVVSDSRMCIVTAYCPIGTSRCTSGRSRAPGTPPVRTTTGRRTVKQRRGHLRRHSQRLCHSIQGNSSWLVFVLKNRRHSLGKFGRETLHLIAWETRKLHSLNRRLPWFVRMILSARGRQGMQPVGRASDSYRT